jgi:hypothetical protein
MLEIYRRSIEVGTKYGGLGRATVSLKQWNSFGNADHYTLLWDYQISPTLGIDSIPKEINVLLPDPSWSRGGILLDTVEPIEDHIDYAIRTWESLLETIRGIAVTIVGILAGLPEDKWADWALMIPALVGHTEDVEVLEQVVTKEALDEALARYFAILSDIEAARE